MSEKQINQDVEAIIKTLEEDEEGPSPEAVKAVIRLVAGFFISAERGAQALERIATACERKV